MAPLLDLEMCEYATDALALAAWVPLQVAAGGTITADATNRIHTFTANDNFVPAFIGTGRVQCWGGGGGGSYGTTYGAGGGGGGAYAETPNVSLVAGTTYAVVVGVGGKSGGSPAATKSTFAATTVVADLGVSVAYYTTAPGAGGLVANCTGTIKYKGGTGGTGNGTDDCGGGGGGAGGPDGAGADGTSASTTIGGDGGAGDAGSGGAGGLHQVGGDGLPGGTDAVHGGGGGGGSDNDKLPGAGGFPGGGSGGGDAMYAYGGAGQVTVSYPFTIYPFSENTIKNQGSYSLKIVAAQTTSLGKTLTKAISPNFDLSRVKVIRFDVRASRTGSNVKFGLHQQSISQAFSQDWATQPYATTSATTVNGVGGILTVTSTSADPYIDMTGLGSFSTVTNNFINIRYRVVSGSPTKCSIYFYNTRRTTMNADQLVEGAVICDGLWHQLALDMTGNANWTSSNVTGWRFDWCDANTVQMEFDNVRLAPDAEIDHEITPNVLVADTFNTYILNLKEIADTAKNKIDKIVFSVANADALNTIYLDNIEVAQASDVFGIT